MEMEGMVLDDGRDPFGWIVTLGMVVIVVVGLALTLGRLSKDATERYEAKQATLQAEEYTRQQQALYALQTEQARLDHKLEVQQAYADAHDQRLATLAIALAGLDDNEQELLLWAAGMRNDWWLYLLAIVLGIGIGVLFIKNGDRIALWAAGMADKLRAATRE